MPRSASSATKVPQKAPRFTVVIPAYNIEAYIDESLRAIANQSFRDFECIVVNDGSTDATESKISRYTAKDKRFHLVSQPNGGLANARNSGLDRAVGDFILFLDGDDRFEERLLEVIDYRLTATGADIIVYNSDEFNDQTKLCNGRPNIIMTNRFVLEHRTFSAADISGEIFNLFYNSVWSKAFRRQMLTDNKLRFDDGLRRIEDLPFTNAAFVVAKSISFVDEILLHYRTNIGHSNTVNNYKHHLDIIRSVGLLHRFLDENGQLERFRRTFDNAVINDSEYYLWWLSLYPEGAETFAEIRRLIREYGIDGQPLEYFHKADYYHLTQVIAHGSYEDYLRYVLRYLRDAQRDNGNEIERGRAAIGDLTAAAETRDAEIGGLRREIDHLRQERDRLNGDIGDLLGSKSYRMGRAMTKPVRIFIDAAKKRQPESKE